MNVLTTRPFFVKFFFHKLSFFLPRSHCRPLVRPFNAPPEFFSRLISRELRSCHPAAFCQVLFSLLVVFFFATPAGVFPSRLSRGVLRCFPPACFCQVLFAASALFFLCRPRRRRAAGHRGALPPSSGLSSAAGRPRFSQAHCWPPPPPPLFYAVTANSIRPSR